MRRWMDGSGSRQSSGAAFNLDPLPPPLPWQDRRNGSARSCQHVGLAKWCALGPGRLRFCHQQGGAASPSWTDKSYPCSRHAGPPRLISAHRVEKNGAPHTDRYPPLPSRNSIQRTLQRCTCKRSSERAVRQTSTPFVNVQRTRLCSPCLAESESPLSIFVLLVSPSVIKLGRISSAAAQFPD
jgi:hypothetical protein